MKNVLLFIIIIGHEQFWSKFMWLGFHFKVTFLRTDQLLKHTKLKCNTCKCIN